MALDFLVIGRSLGLSTWQAQRLWERLTDDPRYHLAPEPEVWLRAAFTRQAAAIGEVERAPEAEGLPVAGRGAHHIAGVGKRTLVDAETQALGALHTTGVGKRTQIEVEMRGRFETQTRTEDLPARAAPVARELPFRTEVEELLGANLGDVRAYTHQDALLAPHGARAAAFRGGIAFAGTPTKEVVAHEAVHALQLRTRGVTRDATAAEAQAEQAARAVARGTRRIALSYVPTAAVSFDKGSDPSPGSAAMFANGVRRLDRSKLIFLGASSPELWNWVKVAEVDATGAEVAALLVEELAWAALAKGSGLGSTWAWAVTPKANAQFEVNAVLAVQFPEMVQYRASGVDQASKNNAAMKRTVETAGIIDGDNVKVAKQATASRARGRAFLSKRLDDMIDEPHWMLARLPQDYEIPDDVATGAGYSTTFEGNAFHRTLRAKLVGYLREHSAGGLRKLLEPADIEDEVAAIIPARKLDWFGVAETQAVADFVGDKLNVATVAALNRLVPRVIEAAMANPTRPVRRSDVPYHGYLDSAVLTALLEDPRPLMVIPTMEQAAAYNKAAAKAAKAEKRRLKNLDHAGLRRMLDQTLVWGHSAREISAPWLVPIQQDLLEWVASHHEHIASMPEDKVRGLVAVIEDQHRVVRAAYSGLQAIAKTSAKPASFEDAKQAPEYGAMYGYAMAISESRTVDDAQRHLANAQAQHRKLSVMTAEQSLRGARAATRQAEVGENEGVRNPREVAEEAQQAAEAAVWKAGQSAVAGTDTDVAQLTDLMVAADERAAVHRLRGIVRKLQQLGEVADVVDSTSALKTLLSVSQPVNQIRVALEDALAKAAVDYKTAGGTDAAGKTWLTQRRELVVNANQALGEIIKTYDLERVVSRAQSEIKDAQTRKIITELIVMFALGLVTGGVATAAGGLVRGMFLARTARGMYVVGEAIEVVGGGGYMMAQLAGGFAALGTDVALMSLGQSAVTGQPLRESLTENLIGSSVMAVAMKPFGAIAQDLKEVGAGLAVKGTVLTLEVIGSSAANFAAMKLQTVGTASEPQLLDWLTQGGMMVVGKAVGTRLAATHTRLAQLGEAAGLRRLASLQKLAKQISQGKNIEALPDLIDGERQVLSLETEAIARARADGTLGDADVAAINAGNQAATADIAPERVAKTLWAARGLEPMTGDGSHWYGTRDQIHGAIADAGPTARLVRETGDSIYAHIDGQDVRFSIGMGKARRRAKGAVPIEREVPTLEAVARQQAEAGEKARLAKIRTGTDRVRGADELSSKDVADSMNAQLQNVKVTDIDAIVGKYPADQQARVSTVLARSSGFGKMEGLNSLRAAMEPHLKSGKKLYTPGQGSLADNMYYLDGEKHSFDTTHANATKPQTTPVVELNSIVILDQVVLAKMNDPKTGKQFGRSLVVNQVVLLDPRGFVDGNNMYNSGSREVIAQRADAVLKRATEIEATQKITFDEAVGKALDETSAKAMDNQEAVVVAALKAKLEVVDPAAHADVSSAAIADQVNSSGEITEAQLAASLAKVPEADRPYLRELLAQQAEIFSPRRQGNELAAQGQRVLDLASAQGIAKDKVFYFIPKPEKSYGMVAMAHREATSTPVGHYIEGPAGLKDAIANGTIDDASMLVILDDVAGSGDSLIGATTIANASGYRGKLAVSPMVSTGTANEVFNGPFGIASSNPNVTYVPGRIAPALRESTYYKSLSSDARDRVEDLLVNLGWGQNGLSMAFPYMAPDNNNQFFGKEIAREYVINRNDHGKAVKTGGPWAPKTTGSKI